MDIFKRWAGHKNYLNKQKHINIYLQRAWNKHGEENFLFSILEEINKESLIEAEQRYIDFYESFIRNNGYNINPKAQNTAGRSCYKTWLEKFGKEKADKMWKEVTIKNSIANSKENNAMWGTKRLEVGLLNKKLKSKPVLQFDINNNLIKEFSSVSQAAKILNINRNTIKNFRNQKDNFAAGFFWKYKL